MNDEWVTALERCRLFEGLGPKELRMIAASAKERSVDAGETIASAGEGGVGFFVVIDGTAHVERDGRQLAKLSTGSSFGEVALLDDRGNRRSASVIAESPVRLLAWSSWTFQALLKEHASLSYTIARSLARMLNDAYAAHDEAAKAPA
jgi:CRP-like cAMP-binding protein